MERVIQGRSATLTHTFFSDGVATNPSPDVATIGITRDDGSVLVAAGSATVDTGTGTVTYTLTPAQTALLDILTLTWTATFGGQSQTFVDIVEVVGNVLFTVAEARAISALSNTSTYPTAAIVKARTTVESRMEKACSVAFVPRYRRETVSGSGSTQLQLSRRLVTAVRSVSLEGTVLSPAELLTIVPSTHGGISYLGGWTPGFNNYSVAYEHGYAYVPPEISDAALTWAKNLLIKGPIDDRTTAFTTEDGTFSMMVPGLRGSISGIPDVDAVLHDHDLTLCVG